MWQRTKDKKQEEEATHPVSPVSRVYISNIYICMHDIVHYLQYRFLTYSKEENINLMSSKLRKKRKKHHITTTIQEQDEAGSGVNSRREGNGCSTTLSIWPFQTYCIVLPLAPHDRKTSTYMLCFFRGVYRFSNLLLRRRIMSGFEHIPEHQR